MRVVLILGLLAGCTCADQDPSSRDLSLPRLAPAMPPAVGQPQTAPRLPAPQREIWGLSLGTTDGPDLLNWITTYGLECEAMTAPRRMTQQQRCALKTLPEVISGRAPAQTSTLLLLARPDEGALHHVSTLRRHSLAEEAVADFAAASTAISAALGQPSRSAERAPSVGDLSGAHARFVSRWDFSDLEVELSLSKVGGQQMIVRERWDVPGVEAGVPPRPGSTGHAEGAAGGTPHSPHGIVPQR